MVKMRDPATLPLPGLDGTALAVKPKKSKREPKPLNDYTRAVDAFDRAYKLAHGGATPTWGPKAGSQIKRLIAAHGADEVIARIERLFGGALDWPRPPYDLGTLVSHFDKLTANAQRRKLTPAEIASGSWRSKP